MIQLLFTKNDEWLRKWDAFLQTNPKGSHLVLSDWLKSYKSYGFDYELGLFLENDNIVGGFGAVIPKVMFFKFYIIPHGFIYHDAYTKYFETHLIEVQKNAKQKGCCYFQISAPISSNEDIKEHTYAPSEVSFLDKLMRPGKLFKYVYTSYGLNWIVLKHENEEELISSFKANTRRDIRAGLRRHDEIKFLKTEAELEKCYQLCQQNADEYGYDLRAWKDFKTTVMELVNKNIAHFIGVFKNNDQKGAILMVQSGGFFTYICGGVKRENPDLLSGYLLQWEALKLSLINGFDGYNISMGGSKGVLDFKSKFGTSAIHYENPHYHMVLKPFYFKGFLFLDKYLKPYKANISKFLSKINR